MKTKYWMVLGVTLATTLFAQPATNARAAAPAAPETPLPPRAPLSKATLDKMAAMTSVFDGRTLNGWVQAPTNLSTFSGADIVDLPSLARKISGKPDPVSAFLNDQLDEAVKTGLAAFSPASTNAKAMKSALTGNLNKLISGSSLYDSARFQNVQLRPETVALRAKNPQGQDLIRLNRLLLEDAYPLELSKSPAASWIVKDGAMASTGAGRGTIYTKGEYTRYRLVFNMRHLGGPPSDHQACFLVFCTTPPEGQKGMDALGGIQFQPPNGSSWDYRPGKNNNGKGLFTRLVNPNFNAHEWSQIEILVNASDGTARMAVAQPPGTKAVEVLDFKDPTAGKKGPIAWQMHNAGLFDEYKDVRIEEDPKDDRLITVEE